MHAQYSSRHLTWLSDFFSLSIIPLSACGSDGSHSSKVITFDCKYCGILRSIHQLFCCMLINSQLSLFSVFFDWINFLAHFCVLNIYSAVVVFCCCYLITYWKREHMLLCRRRKLKFTFCSADSSLLCVKLVVTYRTFLCHNKIEPPHSMNAGWFNGLQLIPHYSHKSQTK